MVRVIEALQQVDQGALADAGWAARRDLEAGGNHRLHVLQDRLRAARPGVVQILQAQFAHRRHRPWRGGGNDGGFLAAQLHHPAQADGHALQRDVQAQQALHRPDGHAQVGGKGDQRTQLPGALHHPVAADQEGTGARQRHQRAGHGLGEEFGELQAQQLAQVALPQPFQAPGFAGLLAGGLDELHGRQRLDEERREVRRALAQAARLALHLAPHPAQPEHVQRNQQRHQQRKLPRQGEQQHQRADQPDHAGHGGEQRVHGEALDLGDVAVEPGHQVADAAAAEEARRERLQVAVQRVAQGEQDAPGQARVQVAVEAGQRRADQADDDHGAGHHHQHREVLRQQAVVDQQLGQPGLRQHQERGAERQAEQPGDGRLVRPHEAIQPAQRGLERLRIVALDQAGEEHQPTLSCLSLRYSVARLMPSASAAAETLPWWRSSAWRISSSSFSRMLPLCGRSPAASSSRVLSGR